MSVTRKELFRRGHSLQELCAWHSPFVGAAITGCDELTSNNTTVTSVDEVRFKAAESIALDNFTVATGATFVVELDGGLNSDLQDLDYMHARYCSPVQGRFLSVDPIESGEPGVPQSWNKYAYSLNNPLKYTDPDGESPTLVTAGIGAAIGATAGALGSLGAQLISNDFDFSAINFQDVGAAAGGGAVSGGLAGFTLGFSVVAQAGVGGVILVSAGSNVVGGAVTRGLDSSAETGALDVQAFGGDFLIGAAGGVVGSATSKALSKPLAQVESQIKASLPAARRGSFGGAQSVRGHTAKAQRIRTRAGVVATVAGAKTTNVIAPAGRALVNKKDCPSGDKTCDE